MKQKKDVQESYHAAKGLRFVESVLLDVRYALRVLRKSPTFTAVALVTLMLGIGANVVVFGVLNAVLFHPLDVSDPQNLYQIRHQQWTIGRLLTTSYPAFEDFQRRNSTFSDMAGFFAYSHGDLRTGSTVVSVGGDEVTGNYFDVLGVQPAMGRFFHAAEEHGAHSAPYLVLSDDLWRRVFQADRGVIGATVDFDKQPFTILGVAPPAFHGTERFAWPDYWIPMANQEAVDAADYRHSRASVAVTVIGRLKPGVTPQQATDNLNAISAQLAREYPETDDGQPLRLIHPGLIGDEGDVIRGFLWSVTALALLVLAAACANLASLFAARASDRSRELALRVALGSSRRRLMGQLLTEVALLSLGGGAAGLSGAGLLVRWLNLSYPFMSSHLLVSMDARVYLVALFLIAASVFLFGLVPAQQAWQSSPLQMMRSGSSVATLLHRFALRDLLLGLQIAICTLLVIALLVAVRGMQRALQVALGFRPQGAVVASVDLDEGEETADGALQKQKELIEVAAKIPGVTGVGAVSRTPLTGGMRGVPIFRPGATDFKLNHSALAPYVFSMSPGYLEAAGTRLLSGRDVSWHDIPTTPYVAIVNQTLARTMWGEMPAIGQRFLLGGKLTEVVGVVEDGKYHDLQEPPQPVVYVPSPQSEDSPQEYVVRSQRMPKEMAVALEHTLGAVAPNVSITVHPWSDDLDGELFPSRVAAASLGVMGLLAAMLAVTGIFGMAAYSVSRRMKELGIRMALGGRRTQIMQAAVGRPIMLLGVGSVAGLVAGMFASQLLGRIVYQANPRDPVVICGAVVTMALLGVAASAIPAWRAMAIDPSLLMREE